ncbi:protein of unknown function [Bradyrhizobium vignae]|uniref:Uncharacterized protein n=1 Tax=Bradyrhizobium vignae TaxID=1549949 RepID=A0A2U3QCF6_9BRAD|nr:protein of unknown function [Bradyrhizobium vignae]
MRSGFPERSCVNNKLKRDDDSSQSHRALGRPEAYSLASFRGVRSENPESEVLREIPGSIARICPE